MNPFCEVVVLKVLPTIRALIAEELINVMGYTQVEAAKMLGVTQPAISQYKSQLRGKKALKIKQNLAVYSLIQKTAQELAQGKEKPGRLCEICREIRRQGLLCEMHQNHRNSFSCTKCKE